MIKSEILEIKRQFANENCSITKICGCYVDGEKNIKTKMSETFLSLSEEEIFKYFEIFKKTLSGTLGKNLMNIDFPMEAEFSGGSQETLMKLRESGLKDEELVDEYYQKIIDTYEFVGNYFIILIHAAYDIPGKAKDKMRMEDASDEVYNYILCSICPVNLSKPGLSYDAEENIFKKRNQDWVVNMPTNGFLFPAFNDRSTDVHSMLYYSKDPEGLNRDFVEQIFGCDLPLSAGGQKINFNALIEETLGEDCDYEIVKNIHENLYEMLEENCDVPEPVMLNKTEVKSLLAESGVELEKLEKFEERFEEKIGEKAFLLAENLANTRAFEVKTPEISIKVSPEYSSLIETKMVDGKKCLVIAISDNIEVNGINVNVNLHGDKE